MLKALLNDLLFFFQMCNNLEILLLFFTCHLSIPILESIRLKTGHWGFPGGAVVENLPANAGDTGSSPGLGGSHMPRSN